MERSKAEPIAFHIHFSPMAPLLKMQLSLQGFMMPTHKLAPIQQDYDAVIRLRLRGYIKDGEYENFKRRIFRKITDLIEGKAE